MKQHNKKHHIQLFTNNWLTYGFTMIELLIVISIIALILTLTLFNYTKSRQTNNLILAAQQLANDINYARDLTLNGVKNQECEKIENIDQKLCSQYTIILGYDESGNANWSKYSLSVEGFNDQNSSGNNYSQMIFTKSLPTGIQINELNYPFIKFRYIDNDNSNAIRIVAELENSSGTSPTNNYCEETNGRRPLLQEPWLCVLKGAEQTDCNNAESKINIYIDCNGRVDIE